MIANKHRRLLILQVLFSLNLDLPPYNRTCKVVEAPRYVVLYGVILADQRQCYRDEKSPRGSKAQGSTI